MRAKFDTLTRREREIFGMLLRGYRNPQIADQLFIAISTVETHRKNLYRKLNIHDRVGVFRVARDIGMIWIRDY